MLEAVSRAGRGDEYSVPLRMPIDHKAEVRRHRVETRDRSQTALAHTSEPRPHMRLVHLPRLGVRIARARCRPRSLRRCCHRELFGGDFHTVADDWEAIEVVVLSGAMAPDEDRKPAGGKRIRVLGCKPVHPLLTDPKHLPEG